MGSAEIKDAFLSALFPPCRFRAQGDDADDERNLFGFRERPFVVRIARYVQNFRAFPCVKLVHMNERTFARMLSSWQFFLPDVPFMRLSDPVRET